MHATIEEPWADCLKVPQQQSGANVHSHSQAGAGGV